MNVNVMKKNTSNQILDTDERHGQSHALRSVSNLQLGYSAVTVTHVDVIAEKLGTLFNFNLLRFIKNPV